MSFDQSPNLEKTVPANQGNKPKVFVHSLGCKANLADGQELEQQFVSQGFEPTAQWLEADTVVINSCTVTNEAAVQSRKWIKQVQKKNPHAKIVYTGCDAEVASDELLKLAGNHIILGNQNKNRASALVADAIAEAEPQVLGTLQAYQELASRHPADRQWPMPSRMDFSDSNPGAEFSKTTTRAFLKIQDGCNSFCTYCIIPYGRGPNRSFPIQKIVEQVQGLVDQGIQEVVLTGINIGDYGMDWAGRLMIDELLESILVETKIRRLRVGSLDPTEISDKMLDLLSQYPAFCPHFHVSLQHTEDKILKLMKRKYTQKDCIEKLQKIAAHPRAPFIGMDVIVGFPGETEEDYLAMKALLDQLPWSRIHVFPYSERDKTPATKLPNSVPVGTRRARSRDLNQLSLERLQSRWGARVIPSAETVLTEVLFEGAALGPDGTRNWTSGYTPDYQRVLVSGVGLKNSIREVQAKRWVVDRAASEVMWIGELMGDPS